MKASPLMFLDYVTMIGVPVLLVLLAAASAVLPPGAVQTVLLLLIGAGCIVFGAIGIRALWIHPRTRR